MSETDSIKAIGVLQLGKLGDMILSTPLFRAIKQVYPDARLTVIVSPDSEIICKHHPDVDEVIAVAPGFGQLRRLIGILRAKKFDLFIDPKDHKSRTSRVASQVLRKTKWMGNVANKPFRGNATLVERMDGVHYVDRMLAPMRLIAPDVEFERRPYFAIPDAAFGAIDRQLTPREDDKGIIAINISAGQPSRDWDNATWKAVIDQMAEEYSVVVMSSPSERARADTICPSRVEAHPVRTDSIIEAAAVVARARVVITPDTSIVHVASVLNTPTLALFPHGEANLASFAPMATRSEVILPPSSGTVADIGVEEVLVAFLRLL